MGQLTRGACVGIFELAFIAVGLSMDAFAVSICKGLGMRRINWKHAFVIALFFGGFQGIMPSIGWALGTQFERYITSVDHWVAFLLLFFIGAKMLWDVFHEDGEDDLIEATDQPLDMREMFMLAVATSIDALAVGITFAFLHVAIVPAALFIAATTFTISFFGVAVGNQFGSRYQRPSSLAGGVVLILIGFKILFEHLGIIG